MAVAKGKLSLLCKKNAGSRISAFSILRLLYIYHQPLGIFVVNLHGIEQTSSLNTQNEEFPQITKQEINS